MDTAIRHIIYLLETRGVVEAPGLGTFSCHHRAATIDGSSLSAPSIGVSFDYDIHAGADDTLVCSIARAEGVDNEAAMAMLNEGLGTIERRLRLEGEASVGPLGQLSLAGDKISFVQSPTWTPAGMKFPDIELQPLKSDSKERRLRPAYGDTDNSREEFMRSLRRTASSAAAIAVFALLAFIVSQIPGRHSEATQASFGYERATLPVAAVQAPPVEQVVQEPQLIVIFNTPADASCEVEYPQEPAADLSRDARSLYLMIVASLASREEAMAFIGDRTDLHLLESGGRYRVYALAADTYDQLSRMAADSDIYANYPSAWILPPSGQARTNG